MKPNPEASKRLSVARLVASEKVPYFSHGLYSLNFRPSKDPVVKGTMGTSKNWVVYYDEEWVLAADIEQLAFALVHELGHLIRDHHERQKDRKAIAQCADGRQIPVWNLAGDAEINDDITQIRDIGEAGKKKCYLPSHVPDEEGKLAEQYYEKIIKDAESDGRCCQVGEPGNHSCGSGSGTGDNPIQEEGDESEKGYRMDKLSKEGIKRKIAHDIQEHAQKSRGTVPGGLERWAEELLADRLPAHVLLAGAVRRRVSEFVRGAVDYSFRCARRRGSPPGVILPGLVQPNPTLGVMIDTSGSMGESELGYALNIVRQATQNAARVQVYSCDAGVHSAQKVWSPTQVTLMGGGGTSMATGVRQVCEQNYEAPDILLIVTDGYTDWPTEEDAKGTKLVWVMTTDVEVPEEVPGDRVCVRPKDAPEHRW